MAATRRARATGDCLRRAPPRFRLAADFRPLRFDALFRFDADFRLADFRRDVLPADLRAPAFFRLDAPFLLDELFLRAPDFLPDLRELPLERPPLREALRDDFFLDAMNSLLVRWWCCEP